MNKTLQQEAEDAAREYVAKNTAVANGSYEQYEAGAGYREGYEDGYISGASKYEAEITRLRTALEHIKKHHEVIAGGLGHFSTTYLIASDALKPNSND